MALANDCALHVHNLPLLSNHLSGTMEAPHYDAGIARVYSIQSFLWEGKLCAGKFSGNCQNVIHDDNVCKKPFHLEVQTTKYLLVRIVAVSTEEISDYPTEEQMGRMIGRGLMPGETRAVYNRRRLLSLRGWGRGRGALLVWGQHLPWPAVCKRISGWAASEVDGKRRGLRALRSSSQVAPHHPSCRSVSSLFVFWMSSDLVPLQLWWFFLVAIWKTY